MSADLFDPHGVGRREAASSSLSQHVIPFDFERSASHWKIVAADADVNDDFVITVMFPDDGEHLLHFIDPRIRIVRHCLRARCAPAECLRFRSKQFDRIEDSFADELQLLAATIDFRLDLDDIVDIPGILEVGVGLREGDQLDRAGHVFEIEHGHGLVALGQNATGGIDAPDDPNAVAWKAVFDVIDLLPPFESHPLQHVIDRMVARDRYRAAPAPRRAVA